MYKVVIADDDYLFRENLKKSIDWNAYNMSVIGEAANGGDALRLIRDLQPDIAICDIKMPVLDGISVLKQLDAPNRLKFIILSGYSDFELAKQAIKYGAFDYALKPLNLEEMFGILLRAADSLNTVLKEQNKDIKNSIKLRRLIAEEYESLFIHLIESRDISSICGYIDDYYREADKDDMQNGKDRSFTEFVAIADKACRMFKLDIISILEKTKPDSIYPDKDKQAEADMIKSVFAEIVNQIITKHNSECRKIIDEVIDYIDKKYMEKISLESISRRYYINPSYFSQVFKSRVGENFSWYLINVRINKAKELLLLDKFKVYQISEMVGYDNEKYFYQIFKKYTGYTPMEYAKSVKPGAEEI